MAEIPVERKGGLPGWIWLLLAAIIIALLIWLFSGGDDSEPTAVVPVEPVAEAPLTSPDDTDTAQPAMTIAAIVENPEAYIGQSFEPGEVETPAVPTDRGFWIEKDGTRMLAVIIDQPREVPLDINPGQTLNVTGGTLRGPDAIGDIPGDVLDADTRALIEEEGVFLLVNEANIDIVEPA